MRSSYHAPFAAALLVLGSTSARAQEPPKPPEPLPESIQLPEVKVRAPSRLPQDPLPASSIPAAVQVIPGGTIRESGSASLQDFLARRLPGVSLSDEQGNAVQLGLSVRGFQGSSVTGIPQGVSVFLDGVRLNEPAVEQINFDLIPLDDIEQIELIRGPSAVFGRNTLGAAINIVTKRGQPGMELVPEAEGGSFGRQKYRLHLGGREGPLDYYMSGTLFREDGWRDDAESRLAKLFATLGYKADGTDVSLSLQHARNRIEQAGSLPLTELRRDRTQNFTSGDFFRPRMSMGTFNLSRQLGDKTVVAVNAFGRLLEAEQFNANLLGDDTRSFTTTISSGGIVQLTRQDVLLGRANRLVAGADYAHHDVRVKVFEEKNARSLARCVDAAAEAGTDPAEACPVKDVESNVRDDQHALGLYVQDTLELGRRLLLPSDSLVLTVATRWDWLRHDITDESPLEGRPSAAGVSTFSRINPRFGINYNLSKDVGTYFAFSQGFRAPAFLELTCAGPAAICPGLQAGVAPDPPLKSVKANNYELGVRARPAPWLEGELSLFRTDVIDDIFSVAPTGTTGLFFQNIGNTRRQGVELSLRGTFKDVLEAHIDYAYTEATFRNDIELATARLTTGCTAAPCTQPVRKGNDLSMIPRHRLNAGIDYHLTRWLTLSLSALYVGDQRLRGDEENVERKLPGYVVVNAGIRARWKDLTGYVAISNVLNNEYETFGTFAPNARRSGAPIEPFLNPAPPLHVVGGLSYRF